MSNNTKKTMREFLAWRSSLTLPYAEFKELAVDSRTAQYHLPPLRRKVMVPKCGIAVLWGGTRVEEREEPQPTTVEVTFSRDFRGRTGAEVYLRFPDTSWWMSFSLHEGDPLVKKLAGKAGLPETHVLPDEVVEKPPYPEWVHLGEGCSGCGGGDYGSVQPRFRWEVVEELEKLLAAAKKGSAMTVVVADSPEGSCVQCGHTIYAGGCPACGAPP